MSTFKELQTRLSTAKFKSAVYQHLVNYLEADFRPVAGADAKKVIITDEKVRVPDTVIEIVVKEILTGLTYSTTEVEQILNLSLGPTPPSETVVQTPVAPVQNPQGEVK